MKLGEVDLKKFSCGECYVRFKETLRGKDVYILQTGTLNPNEDLMELYLMCQAAKLSFANTVNVIIPHFPYARQDRVVEPREPISSKLVAHLLESSGADHIITLDLHSRQIQGFFSIPADSLEARNIFAEYFKEKKEIKNPVIVAPDVGSAKQSKKLADAMGAELVILHKTRPEHQEAEILEVVGHVEGKTCIIFDDMIDTAGTLVSAKEKLIELGANLDVYAAATHAVFSGPAIERLSEANFKEVIVTDSIPIDEKTFSGLKIISIVPMMAEVIRHIERGESVTEIYLK